MWGLNAACASRCPLPSTNPRRPVPAEEGPLTSAEVHLDPLLPIFPSPTRPPAAVGTRQRAPSDWGRCLDVSSLHSQQPSTDTTLTTQVYRRGSRSGVRPSLGQHGLGAERIRTSSEAAPSRRCWEKWASTPQPLRLAVPETVNGPLTGEPRAA